MEANQNIFHVNNSFTIRGKGVVAVGELISGQIKKGMKVTVNNLACTVLGNKPKTEKGSPLLSLSTFKEKPYYERFFLLNI